MLRILSLGAGVQSTTVALLSSNGLLPPIDCAIFADTGWEPIAVYTHLAWLEQQLPFKVHHVSAGTSIKDQNQRIEGARFVSLPMYTQGGGRLRRECTRHWKLDPIHQKIRELLGLAKGEHAKKWGLVQLWIGISLDEADRMRDSEHTWIQHYYPLCEQRPMTRQDCLRWLKKQGYPEPARSSCVGCPYHTQQEWRHLKKNCPTEFSEAVQFERTAGQARGPQNSQAFLHQARIPLDTIDFSTLEDQGQLNWLDECTGMCGN
jgi:hypothetical protein